MYKDRYEKNLKELLDKSNKEICKENRALFKVFFEKQERKLKQRNGLMSLDEPCYKTLCDYITRFKNVNKWFDNKPLKKITKKDFEKVFDDLCDGKILNSEGKPFESVEDYVFKIFRGKLFRLAGKSDIVEEVTEFYDPQNKQKAEYMLAADIFNIIDHAANDNYKLAFTLGFDIGENVSSIIQLKKKNCRKEFNAATKEYEYHIILNKEILKRSRTPRTEPTRISKSVELLDAMLKDLKDEDFIFQRNDNMSRGLEKNGEKRIPFSLRSAEIVFDRLVKKLGIKTLPENNIPSLKHLRSSMACDCLIKDWSVEEINGRLGHSPNSRALKPYVTLLALDKIKTKPKIREYKENIASLNETLKEQKDTNALLEKRQTEIKQKFELEIDELKAYKAEMESRLERNKGEFTAIKSDLETMRSKFKELKDIFPHIPAIEKAIKKRKPDYFKTNPSMMNKSI